MFEYSAVALSGRFISSAVLSLLLYGLEHCAIGPRDKRCLDGFSQRLTKCVMMLLYNYHLSYQEAEQQLGVARPSHHLAIGQALRSEDTVFSEVLTFVLAGFACGRGRPRRRFFDTFKADLTERHVDPETKKQCKFWLAASLMVSDHRHWKSIVNMGNDGKLWDGLQLLMEYDIY